MTKRSEISKPIGRKLVELKDSLLLIRDSCKNCREGKSYFLTAISGQLRAIITEKNRDSDALLELMAREFDINLSFYCMRGVDDPDAISQQAISPILIISGFPITQEREYPGQICLSLPEFLKLNILKYKENTYNVSDIIKIFSNKLGGSHYSKSISSDFSEILNFDYLGLPSITQFLVQLGEAVVQVGYSILAKFSNQDTYFLFGFKQIPDSNVCLIDAFSPHSLMRTTCHLKKNGALDFRINGIDGYWAQISSIRPVPSNKINIVQMSIRITNDLRSIINLSIDNQNIYSNILEFPILNSADWGKSNCFINKKNDEDGGHEFSMFVLLFASFGREISSWERATILADYGNNNLIKDRVGIYLQSNDYLEMPIGESDFKFVGGEMISISVIDAGFTSDYC